MFNLFVKTLAEKKTDTICFNLILFDIFFIPLFPWFSVSVSLPIIIYWYLTNWKKLLWLREYRYLGIVVVLMTISTLFCFIDFGEVSFDTSFSTSLKRFFQYLFSFWYYFFFLYFFVRYKRNITNIVFWGVIVITIYAIIYSVNPDFFFLIKRTLCHFDPQVVRADTFVIFRYNYLWADPNNVAYATTGLVLFFLIEAKGNIFRKYIAIACLIYILLCTMSIGGLLVAIGTVGYVTLFSNRLRQGKTSFILGLIILIVISSIIVHYMDFFLEMYDNGIRARQNIYGESGLSGGGGRWADFIRGVERFNLLFLTIGSGQEGFVHEIGHFYLICLYGFPVYIYFMYILFGKKRRQTFMEYMSVIPFFLGFTMNIAIGEQKYLLMLLLISAYYAARSYNLKPLRA